MAHAALTLDSSMESTSDAVADARASLDRILELQARIKGMQATKLDARALPTLPALESLLPGGALRAGSSYSVHRSALLAMALLAGPSAAGSWCAVVGMPTFGAEAASGLGIDLDRLVLVPDPGEQWLGVTAAMADVVTVVLTRPPGRVSPGDLARLSARLRQRGAALVVLGDWPQSEATLRVSGGSWEGIGHGHGHLAARRVTVTSEVRGAGRPASTTLWLPDARAAVSAVEPVDVRTGVDFPDRDLDLRDLPDREDDAPARPTRHLHPVEVA